LRFTDNYDPSGEDKAMERDIDVLNEEMAAAGIRIFVGGLRRQAARSRWGRSPMARCSSPMGRTWRPRNIENFHEGRQHHGEGDDPGIYDAPWVGVQAFSD